ECSHDSHSAKAEKCVHAHLSKGQVPPLYKVSRHPCQAKIYEVHVREGCYNRSPYHRTREEQAKRQRLFDTRLDGALTAVSVLGCDHKNPRDQPYNTACPYHEEHGPPIVTRDQPSGQWSANRWTNLGACHVQPHG